MILKGAIVKVKQAGAELCQAQKKLGIAKPALPSKKLRWSSILKEAVFHQKQN